MIGTLVGAITGFPIASSYDSITTTTLGSNQSSVTLSLSGVSGYKHLQIRLIGRTTRVTAGVGSNIDIQFNSDTGANYTQHQLTGNGSSVNAYGSTAQTAGNMTRLATDAYSANIFGANIIDILDYTNTNKYKTVRSIGGYDGNGSGELWFTSSLWLNTAAITSISLIATGYQFTTGSTFALYGIKEA